tara:strand:- start:204 stop:332 length:129 start_codon:yes stop_codon:yes gene_type:complete
VANVTKLEIVLLLRKYIIERGEKRRKVKKRERLQESKQIREI